MQKQEAVHHNHKCTAEWKDETGRMFMSCVYTCNMLAKNCLMRPRSKIAIEGSITSPIQSIRHPGRVVISRTYSLIECDCSSSSTCIDMQLEGSVGDASSERMCFLYLFVLAVAHGLP